MEQKNRFSRSERDSKVLCKKLTGFCEIDGIEYVMVCLPLSQSDHSSSDAAKKGKEEGDIMSFLIKREAFANSKNLTRDELFYRINRLAGRSKAGEAITPIEIISVDDVFRTNYSDIDIIHLRTAPDSLQANIEVKETFDNGEAEFPLRYSTQNTEESEDSPFDLVVRHAMNKGQFIKWRFVIGISGNKISAYFCSRHFWNKVIEFWNNGYKHADKYNKNQYYKSFHVGESDLESISKYDKCIITDTTEYKKDGPGIVDYNNDSLLSLREFIARKMLDNKVLFSCCEGLSLGSFKDFSLKL